MIKRPKIAIVGAGGNVGAAVAQWAAQKELGDLTAGQSRKPLVGAGGRPWRIPPTPLGDATLLVASDGLFRYAQRAAILRVATGDDLAAAAQALIELVRLPSGALQDDVAVVLCRELRERATADDVRAESAGRRRRRLDAGGRGEGLGDRHTRLLL
jgi:hypothetical protein